MYCTYVCTYVFNSQNQIKLPFVPKIFTIVGIDFCFYNGGMKYGRIFSQNEFLLWWFFTLGRDNLELFLFVAVRGENSGWGVVRGGGVENFVTNLFSVF